MHQHQSTHIQRAHQQLQCSTEPNAEEIRREQERGKNDLNKYIAKYQEAMSSDLPISQPGEENEKEADAVADKVSNGEESGAVMPKSEDKVMAKSEGRALKATGELQAKLESSKGSGQAMDDKTREEMEHKMGADLSDVRVHTGTEAHDMSEGINAKAFTYGQDVYFKNGNYDPRSNEGKKLLAHELTHTQQQKGGVKRMVQRYTEYSKQDQNKLAQPGEKDSQESKNKYSDYLGGLKADLIKAEKKKKAGKMQHYTMMLDGWRHPSRSKMRVSDDGKMAIEAVTFNQSINAWADESKIDESNKILKERGSYVELKKEAPSGLEVGKVPADHSDNQAKNSFKKITPVHKDGKNEEVMTDPKSTTDRKIGNEDKYVLNDCGKACGVIMGADNTRKVLTSDTGDMEMHTRYDAKPFDQMFELIFEIMKKEHPAKVEKETDPVKVYDIYRALTPEERNAIDMKYKLNKYAAPETGQGITALPMKEYKGKEYHKYNAKKQGGSGGGMVEADKYQFHFGTNIMTSGSDYITLEGLGGHDKWFFWMYGSKEGQSFFEEHGGGQYWGTPEQGAVVDDDRINYAVTNASADIFSSPGETKAIKSLGAKTSIYILLEKDQANPGWMKVIEITNLNPYTVGERGWIREDKVTKVFQ
jgi:hypothetical protein